MIAVTVGDPAGIGPEVALKAAARLRRTPLRLIGSRDILGCVQDLLGLHLDLGRLVDDVGPVFSFTYGRVQKRCGAAALAQLERGLELVEQGAARALVTGPISKEAIWETGVRFPGHTELLARRTRTRDYCMAAVGPGFAFAFVTAHQPLKTVARVLTADAVHSRVVLLERFLRTVRGLRRPRIAVLGFNPHGREFTTGEEERVQQAVLRVRRAGVNASGPFPADTIVRLVRDYDGIVALYHDQGMVAAKLLARDRGVNVTLGLPFVRTSPLHGTAFDIAGQGVASSHSMEAAIRLAVEMAKRKTAHA